MRFLKAIAIASFLISFDLEAQNEYRSQEVSIANENDVYLFQNIDKYYSNGIFFNYRFVPSSSRGKRANHKQIFDLGIVQKFWTPQNLSLIDPEDYERPYAGMLSLNFRFSEFPKSDRRLAYGFDFGVIGKASGAQAFQEWYHKVFGFPQPLGWEYQVPNGMVFDFKFEYNRQFFLVADKMDLVSSTSASLGTGFTNMVQRLDVRVGKLKDLNRSALFNALIGEGSPNTEVHHYFLLGYGVELVGHNTTIEGHVFDNIEDFRYAETALGLVRHLRIGFATSSNKATFKVTYNWLSKEVDQRGAGRHAYVGFQLDIRLISKRPNF